jgi:hypothetical protein
MFLLCVHVCMSVCLCCAYVNVCMCKYVCVYVCLYEVCMCAFVYVCCVCCVCCVICVCYVNVLNCKKANNPNNPNAANRPVFFASILNSITTLTCLMQQINLLARVYERNTCLASLLSSLPVFFQ